jgi:ATP-dependent DNA helicase RecG
MGIFDPVILLKRLCSEPRETEWLEFKHNAFMPDKVGQYISGLANSAMLCNQAHGYLVFGVENDTHRIVGTTVRLREEKVGGEPFLNWVTNRLDPKLALELKSFDCDGRHIEMPVVEPTYQHPVRFTNVSYIRVGQQLRPLDDFPARARAIWITSSRFVFETGIAVSHLSFDEVVKQFNISKLLEMLGKPKMSEEAILYYLLTEGLIIDDMQGGFDVTNLCALLCAKNIKLYPSVAGKAPRVITYKGTSKLEATLSRSRDFSHTLRTGHPLQKLSSMEFAERYTPIRK